MSEVWLEGGEAEWNAFLAWSHNMPVPLQPAADAFLYFGDTKNGGHHQFLVNKGIEKARSIIDALRMIGAPEFAELLSKAVARWTERTRERPHTAEKMVEQLQEGEFKDLDAAFYRLADDVDRGLALILRRFVRERASATVEFIQPQNDLEHELVRLGPRDQLRDDGLSVLKQLV